MIQTLPITEARKDLTSLVNDAKNKLDKLNSLLDLHLTSSLK